MQSADRLVTYWGTYYIRSACFGLKPITARETQLSYYDKNLVLYPTNLKIYKILLTKKKNTFRLKKNQIHTSRFLLYLREKVLNFVKDVNQRNAITRGDSKLYK